MGFLSKRKNRITMSQSASYGSMSFWKNKDFWQSILLYIVGGLFLVLMLMGLAKTTN